MSLVFSGEYMKYKVRRIRIDEPLSIIRLFSDDKIDLKDISNINIFVGKNNSGKSLLLRTLFESSWEYRYKNHDEIVVDSILKKCKYSEKKAYEGNPLGSSDASLVKYRTYHKELNNFLSNSMIGEFQKEISLIEARHNNVHPFVSQQVKDLLNGMRDERNRYYIPILRGLRTFSNEPLDSDIDIYGELTVKDYFNSLHAPSSEDQNQEIFSGLSFFTRLTDMLLGEPEQRESIVKFQEKLSLMFFESKDVTLIPHWKKKVVHIKIGEETQLPIYSVGDGLQNLIICTFHIITQKEERMFFIEEPENYMHPGMQRSFMELLREYDHHQYFLTTHSNHLLSIASENNDVSIYHFNKKTSKNDVKFEIELRGSGDQSILRSLGVQNSSVFLANCTIWVEGITDRFYLKPYMKKYLEELEKNSSPLFDQYKNYREDLHYSFVEYQGSTVKHWGFDNEASGDTISTKKRCGNPLLIADGDITKKGDRVKILKNALGNDLLLLKCKEIENIIPEEVVKNHPRVSGNQIDKGKISFSSYYVEDNFELGIGTYLQELYDEENIKFAANSGTIKEKMKFCTNAVQWMKNNWDEWELNDPIRKICEAIFYHIKKYN